MGSWLWDSQLIRLAPCHGLLASPPRRWLPWATPVRSRTTLRAAGCGGDLPCCHSARGLIGQARLLTAVSWLTYPGVYIVKMMGISGATATAAEQIGYSVADVVAKAVFGVLIWAIAAAKSDAMEKEAIMA